MSNLIIKIKQVDGKAVLYIKLKKDNKEKEQKED